MLNFIGTIVILKGLNVYSSHSMSFGDAEGIACIDGKMGNWQNQLIILLINSELKLGYLISNFTNNGIRRDNRKFIYISHQQWFQRLPLSHHVALGECDNQTKFSTNKFKTLLYFNIIQFKYFYNATLLESSRLSRMPGNDTG